LTIAAPAVVETASYTLVNLSDPVGSREQYRCQFKANTAIDAVRTVAGNDDVGERKLYRLFLRRDRYRAAVTPLKTAPDYVHPDKIVRWLDL